MDPVRAGDGKVYERSAIEDWIANKAPPRKRTWAAAAAAAAAAAVEGRFPALVGASTVSRGVHGVSSRKKRRESARVGIPRFEVRSNFYALSAVTFLLWMTVYATGLFFVPSLRT